MLVRGHYGVFFCQTPLLLTKFRRLSACPQPFWSDFLSNAPAFDKIPAAECLSAAFFGEDFFSLHSDLLS